MQKTSYTLVLAENAPYTLVVSANSPKTLVINGKYALVVLELPPLLFIGNQ